MPAAGVTTSSFYLPDINIAPWLEDPGSPSGQHVVNEVRRACTSTGFFQLTGHGFPPAVVKDIFAAAAKFFALPKEIKQDLNFTKNAGFRGYELIGAQVYEADVLPDLKEGFLAGIDLPRDDARVQNKRFFAGQNVWPSPDVLPYSEFRTPVETYYKSIMQLCWTVMDLIAATLPYGPNIFDEWKAHEPACPLRLLHYPPTPKHVAGKTRQLGSSAHTDFGGVTLLLQDSHDGLEILDRETRSWVPVPPKPGAFVINVADMMTMITGGEYKSSMHRVINQNETDRYSVVFFMDGNVDYKLRRLDKIGQPVGEDEELITVEEYMLGKRNTTYVK
jgi:isopenicillin N synthase-like dioxygenase